jgi:hypothetical protein
MNNFLNLLSISLVLVALVGCGSGRFPVTGIVKYADGTPCPGGTVIAEGNTADGKLVSLQGNIEPDGKFTLGSLNPGEGGLPGSYKVMVMPIALSDFELGQGKKPDVSGKFGKFETSGLTFEVKDGPTNVELVVTKP